MLTTTFKDGAFGSDPADLRHRVFPRLTGENRDANIKLVTEFTKLAEAKGCSTSQLALAWLIKQGNDVIPIPGTKKIKYLEDNWQTLKVDLTDEDEKSIRHFVETTEIAGERLPDSVVHLTGGDTKEENV